MKTEIIEGMPDAEYRAVVALSQSVAGEICNRSPAHGWHKFNTPDVDPSDEMIVGSIVDAAILGVASPSIKVVSGFDDWRKADARAIRDQIKKEGYIPVLQRKVDDVLPAAQRMRDALSRKGVNFDGAHQVSVFWVEKASDGTWVQCKARLDDLSRDCTVITDLKTTYNAAPGGLGNSWLRFGYDIQAAAYVRGVVANKPDLAGRVSFRFATVESGEPYEAVIARPAGSMRDYGEMRWRHAVDVWARGIATGEWPGYPESVEVEVPNWAMDSMLIGGSNASF